MARTIPEWVKIGAEVAICSNGYGRRYDRIEKIAKVHKSGNFVLNGSDQQWRPWDGSAHKTGSISYSREYCKPLTDEVRAEILLEQRAYDAKKILSDEGDRLTRLARSNNFEAMIAAADAIIARSVPSEIEMMPP